MLCRRFNPLLTIAVLCIITGALCWDGLGSQM
jgi:hypothetical protein